MHHSCIFKRDLLSSGVVCPFFRSGFKEVLLESGKFSKVSVFAGTLETQHTITPFFFALLGLQNHPLLLQNIRFFIRGRKNHP